MRNKVIWALAVLNIALLGMLIGRFTSDNAAVAQANRRPSDVIMIPGELPSGSNAILYLVDVGNHQLSAMAYSGQTVDFLSPPVDLDRLFERAAQAVGQGGTGTGAGPGAGGGTMPPRNPRAR